MCSPMVGIADIYIYIYKLVLEKLVAEKPLLKILINDL